MAFLNEAFVKQYSSNVLTAVQQKGSRFRGTLREETLQGEEGYFEVVNSVAAATIADNFTAGNMHPDTVITDTTWDRRRVTTAYYSWADIIENKDKIRMLVDPTSTYVQAASWAMGRAMDDVIIAAATGTAYTGHDGTTAVALPSSQIIADGGTDLTLAKLLQAKEILDSSDVDPEEPRFLVCTADQVTSLFNDLTASNLTRDAETVRAIAQGQLNTYMGFRFIRSQRLATKTAVDGTGTDDICFAWTQEGLLLARGVNPIARITERADKNYGTQVYFAMAFGATRMDEKRVVEIDCERGK